MCSVPDTYILPPAESRAIFEREIVPAEFGDLPDEVPGGDGPNNNNNNNNDNNDNNDRAGTTVAVLVVGQTGAGKTRTAPLLQRALTARHGRVVHLVADTYKTYHPAFARLARERPALASPGTGTDARRWLAMAARHAIRRRLPVLLESACRHPGDFAELARAFRDGGYRVEVAVMAVPEGLSRLGILTRFYERAREGAGGRLPARLTPKAVHDDSYAGLLEAAQFVDLSDAVDQVVVVRRDNLVSYVNERMEGHWRDPPLAAETICRERERPLTDQEDEDSTRRLMRLRLMGTDALRAELGEIEELLSPLAPNNEETIFSPLRPLRLPCQDHEGIDKEKEADLCLGFVPS
ncbi:zeta toxin [Xylariaceae sp. FL0016]|nr:zeta toxin [Xylariaceae sp. FL0016]